MYNRGKYISASIWKVKTRLLLTRVPFRLYLSNYNETTFFMVFFLSYLPFLWLFSYPAEILAADFYTLCVSKCGQWAVRGKRQRKPLREYRQHPAWTFSFKIKCNSPLTFPAGTVAKRIWKSLEFIRSFLKWKTLPHTQLTFNPFLRTLQALMRSNTSKKQKCALLK